MDLSFLFFLNAFCLGVGLAIDAMSVSMANGLSEPKMKRGKMLLIAAVFSLFQTIMPMIGWVCVHTIASIFTSIQKYIPWIALSLLLFIGGKMLVSGLKSKSDNSNKPNALVFGTLIIQGIATSIDALSVGLTISSFNLAEAIIESIIIGVVTFILCYIGLLLGKAFGTTLAGKASVIGGIILIFIGIEIFVKGVFFS